MTAYRTNVLFPSASLSPSASTSTADNDDFHDVQEPQKSHQKQMVMDVAAKQNILLKHMKEGRNLKTITDICRGVDYWCMDAYTANSSYTQAYNTLIELAIKCPLQGVILVSGYRLIVYIIQ